MDNYLEFIQSKSWHATDAGFEPGTISSSLFNFQRPIVRWACRRGKAALFEDTGLGKSIQQLEWSRLVHNYTGGDILIAAPICVAQQTASIAKQHGIDVNICRSGSDWKPGINITNYEMLHHFESCNPVGIVPDEGSIIKSIDGRTRNYLIERFADVPFKLICTATPSPNDHMELGSYAEFLGIMKATEMLSMFFTHDGGNTSKWRLRGHGKTRFWEWLSTWAICIKRPSDIGYPDDGYNLPPLNIVEEIVESSSGFDDLMPGIASTLSERRQAKRESLTDRVKRAADIANSINEQFIVWCHLNDESTALASAIDGAVEVTGSMKIHEKESAIMAFTNGDARVLVSKPSICGFGMNWQQCRNQIWAGLNDSWEEFYQGVRRSYRFGQKQTVNIWTIVSSAERAVLENIRRKQTQNDEMSAEMICHMRTAMNQEIHDATVDSTEYKPTKPMELPAWLAA